MSARVNKTLLILAVEYIIITSPVLIYVGLEAMRHHDLMYLITSPEWSVATIFLTIQSARLFLESVHGTSARHLSYPLIILLAVLALLAGVDIYLEVGVSLPSLQAYIYNCRLRSHPRS